jgi:hypothetical protein
MRTLTEEQERDLINLQVKYLKLIEFVELVELVARPVRPDGTYNRCREALELSAKQLLEELREI